MIDVRPTAIVMIATRPGSKPTPHVVDASTCDELITALCAAKTVCIAGQAALDAAQAALAPEPEPEPDGVVEATITEAADEPSMSFAAVVEAVNPMSRSQLRAVIVDAWTEAPRAAEQAIADVQRNASERGQDPLDPDTWVKDEQAAAVLAASIETGTPLTVADDARVNGADVLLSALADAQDDAAQDEDETLPDCGNCGCAEVGHARVAGQPIATGECRHRTSCGCGAYQLPDGDGEALPVSYLPLPGPVLPSAWHEPADRMREANVISITGGAR